MKKRPLPQHFLHGAAVYPEFLERDEWVRLLDDLAAAHMNTVRLLESAWGWLQPAQGVLRHAEAVRWLDDAHERGLGCILGTGSFLPPQWFYARHPDALVLTRSGERAHPLARKSACPEYPAYRQAVREQTAACAVAWSGHPSVIGWQVDNEMDRVNLDWTCHCPCCERAWTAWLTRRFDSVEVLNRRMRLDHWGLRIDSFEALPLPRIITEVGKHPGLVALEARFRRDQVSGFLREQTEVLRANGASQPVSHNFFITGDFTAEDSGQEPFLDHGAYDLYLDWQAVEDAAAQLRPVRLMEQQRGCHHGAFVVMETSPGTVGGSALVAPSATAEVFLRRLMLAVASGARGILYWTGNIWRGGPWIFHGALHDYRGQRLPEWSRFEQFGALLARHGEALRTVGVCKDVAVIGSHAGDALAATFSVFPGSDVLGHRFESVCRRRGLAVDVVTPRQVVEGESLKRYRVVVLMGGSQGLGSPELARALERFAAEGGTVIVGPLAGYVTEEGTIPEGGLGSGLESLTGARLSLFRWFGINADIRIQKIDTEGAMPAMQGLVEHAVPADAKGVSVAARFVSRDPSWNGMPALLRREAGRGTVWKYLALPDAGPESEWTGLPGRHPLLETSIPEDVLCVPRCDGSLFLVNLAREERTVRLARGVFERLSGAIVGHQIALPPNGFAWCG